MWLVFEKMNKMEQAGKCFISNKTQVGRHQQPAYSQLGAIFYNSSCPSRDLDLSLSLSLGPRQGQSPETGLIREGRHDTDTCVAGIDAVHCPKTFDRPTSQRQPTRSRPPPPGVMLGMPRKLKMRNSARRETPGLSVVTPNYHQHQHPAAPTAERLLRTDGPFVVSHAGGRERKRPPCDARGVVVRMLGATGIQFPKDAQVFQIMSLFAFALRGGKHRLVKASVSEVSQHGSNMTSENVSSSD
ncbi:hypothetical protein JOQ06_025797, partial [Pogonophryne albipinna]